MTYSETIQYLYNAAPLFQQVGAAAYKEGLEVTRTLDEHYGHPHRSYPTIHLAGTNGKGSCAHTIAAALQKAGLRVGLYTSPHLVDFRERIRVNGKMIAKQRVVDFVEKERAFFEPLRPSFFELTTALAFKYFEEQEVDVAVIETGLGGRLDCTNIIHPILSIITNISFDHTQFLGNTLAAIAGEKAGIIKARIPVVVGESVPETRTVFEAAAHAADAPIRFADEEDEIVCSQVTGTGERTYETRHYGTLQGNLSGECQIHNTATVLCALDVLKDILHLPLTSPAILRSAFADVCTTTGLQGRWQVTGNRPEVVCDTGHNLGGWKYLAKSLQDYCLSRPRVHVVFGMAADKDVEAVLSLLPTSAVYYFTQASVRRAMPAKELLERAQRFNLAGKAYPSVDAATEAAMKAAHEEDFVYIGGSSFIVADYLACQGYEQS